MDVFSKTSQFPKKHHRCISLESGQPTTKKSYPKTPLDLPRFFPRRYSTPELAMRRHALKHLRDDISGGGGGGGEQPISDKSCQTDMLGLDKYLQRSSPPEDSTDSATTLRTYAKKPSWKRPKVRSVAVHCERRRLTFAAFKGCQKFKHVYKRKISLPQPPSTATSTDDGRRGRDSGVLPKLRLDRQEPQDTRPAATKTGAAAAVKLPRISTRDAAPEPDVDRTGGGGTRLAKLTRPQSTGGSSSGGGGSGDRKLAAYFRVSSAPKIDSTRCYDAAAPSEPEQSSAAGSSDTADTAVDVSFVRRRRQLQRTDDDGDATTTSTAASTTVPTITTTTTTTTAAAAAVTTESTSPSSATRTVSTSTTFAEPVFPIVFSCESVLRHPLDGGYVSHTESHRFSVHYVPVNEVGATEDDGSSLVFTSAGACRSERCLTGGGGGDSISVTLCGRSAPDDRDSSACHGTAAGERRLVVERLQQDAKTAVVGDDSTETETGLYYYVPGRGNDEAADGGGGGRPNASSLEKAVPPAANKTDGAAGGGDVESHAHADDEDDMPLRSDGRNYERLTQNRRNVDRTVSNQSPKLDGGGGGENAPTEPVEINGDEHASESDQSPSPEPCTTAAESTNLRSCSADSTNIRSCSADSSNPRSCSADSTKQPSCDADSTNPQSCSVDSTNLQSCSVELINLQSCSADSTNLQSCSADSTADEQHDYERIVDSVQPSTGETMPSSSSHHRKQSEHAGCSHRRNVPPKRLYDDVSRKRDEQLRAADRHDASHRGAHVSATTGHADGRGSSKQTTSSRQHQSHHHHQCGGTGRAANESHHGKHVTARPDQHADDEEARHGRTHGKNEPGHGKVPVHGKEPSHGKGPGHGKEPGRGKESSREKEPSRGKEPGHGKEHLEHDSHGKSPYAGHPRRCRLESVDESAESKESNYVGGCLFGGNAFYRKQSHKRDSSPPPRSKYGYYNDDDDDPKRAVNFSSSKPGGDRYEYYQDYASKTRHSPGDEDCTVFADVAPPPRDEGGGRGVKGRGEPRDKGDRGEPRYSTGATKTHTPPPQPSHSSSYYSQLRRDDKNTDSDESLTDSLEDAAAAGKYDGPGVSYFLSLSGRKSAVTFTLKMPDTLETRLNRRHSMLKKHLHVSTTVRKTSTRVRTRHKGCQTLWTEEKGVQVQRGSTGRRSDDRRALETLLAGLRSRDRVSEEQIRVVGGQKMVSEGNQTEPVPEPAADRHTQTTRDVAAGPGGTPGDGDGDGDAAKKFASDNALMVGVVRRNKLNKAESEPPPSDRAKNDQRLTLSKGWINFYTLRSDSADAAAGDARCTEPHENNDEVRHDEDNQQYTVHVQAIPEPVTLPVVHVPGRNTLQIPKTCSTTKHLPRLVQTETNNNHHCPSHLATTNGWCVSVDGPNNMHMKVSVLPDKSDIKTSEHLDLNEEKLEARRLALQRKNNYTRKPYKNMKRTQSTPRDMFSADVSRTESALSAESKYIETIDTQLLIHKARRRLSQEWDTRIQNGGVTESVQLVVTGDSVSSRTSQHYAARGHQHCSFRRQSRRI